MSTVVRSSLAVLLLTIASAAWPEWRQPDPANLLYMQLPQGEVVMELAPGFAPKNVANIKVLARERYFDGLAVIRSQDNYVVQWGDPAETEDAAKPLGSAAASVPPEFQRAANEVDLSAIASRDAYADIVGFVDGFPAASDGKTTWLTHCYGMVGVARGNEPDSGNGSSLYVVTGHAPRHLDRNITLVGRVISGIENLTTLPRGTAAMGFYESAVETTPIIRVRVGDDLPDEDRLKVEIMRTDSSEFSGYVKSRTTRTEEWFVEPTGRIEICNVSPPVRAID
ncbi:MAG: peptidylprolyl isomerase [Gammaproteobacteria bacterium]|nr:peptidylprolyl isomerase [Gammaproteobacteria bacterium]